MSAGEKAHFEPFVFLVSISAIYRSPQLILPCSPTHFCIQRFYNVPTCHYNGTLKHSKHKVCPKSTSAWRFIDLFIVVELSWDRKFEGPAADALLQTISTCLAKTQSDSSS